MLSTPIDTHRTCSTKDHHVAIEQGSVSWVTAHQGRPTPTTDMVSTRSMAILLVNTSLGDFQCSKWSQPFLTSKIKKRRAYEGRCYHICRLSSVLEDGVLIKASRWLNLGVAISTSSCEFFCDMTWLLQPSGLVVNDCKFMLHGVMPNRHSFNGY